LVLVAACGGTHTGADAGKKSGSKVKAVDAGRKARDTGVARATDAGERDGGDAGGCSSNRDCAAAASGRALCDTRSGKCVGCLVDSDCGSGELCAHSACVKSAHCQSSLDCQLGSVCDRDAGACVECVVADDCQPQYACVQSHCQPPCRSDKDCTPLGRLCEPAAGHCMPPDAGMQSLHPDTGTQCASADLEASRIIPTVMLVIDGSGSMIENAYPASAFDAGMAFPPPTVPTDKTRWAAIRRALVDPTDGVVPRLAGMVKFGLAIFASGPTNDAGVGTMCPFPLGIIDPAQDNAAAIVSAFPASAPGLYTPTGDALSQIAERLAGVARASVILATDGDPNSCGAAGDPFTTITTNYQPSLDAAEKLKAQQQRMYVISVGDDASAAHLQQMANLGAGLARDANPGAPFYLPDDPAALTSTFAMLLEQQLSCELVLSGSVKAGNECMGLVTLNGTALECTGADGWKLNDPTHIELSGTACQQFKAASSASVRATFPCSVLVSP
jgi:hypothetical protein